MTIPALNDALSRMPLTRIIVTSTVMSDGGQVQDRPGRHQQAGGRVEVERRVGQSVRQAHAEKGEEVLKIVRPPVGDGRRGDGVLEDEVPADDPRDQLAERGVGVGIGRSGDGHHRGELGVAERREDAGRGRRPRTTASAPDRCDRGPRRPTSTKIPVPMMAPMPRLDSCTGPSTRCSRCSPCTSSSSAFSGFRSKRCVNGCLLSRRA